MTRHIRSYARSVLSIMLVAVLLGAYPLTTSGIASAQSAGQTTASQQGQSAPAEDTATPQAAIGGKGNETTSAVAAANPTMTVSDAAPAGTVNNAPAGQTTPTLTVGQDDAAAQPDTAQQSEAATTQAATSQQAATDTGGGSGDGPTTTATAAAPTVTTTQTTTIRNDSDAAAASGDAAVTDNYTAGDAGSGNATADTTLVNVVGSATGLGGGTHTTFTRDIYGDVQGNLLIDPATLKPVNGTSSVTLANPTQNSLSLVDIENNVNLAATSGNANVINNYLAGDATTGDAAALANIVNIVSSSVGAQNSFVGVVNIHGNLRGDILVPRSFIDELIASNAASPATTGEGAGGGTLTSNINIVDNVNLNAISGNATVAGNYQAGDATSGDAATSLTVFNLTGQQVIAKNSLLVFVNVMGKWVGMIVDAPAGATAAALGGGVESATTHAGAAGDHAQTVNIRNNITANAQSGHATVAGNRTAGDASTGDASAGANILNLVHSSFDLGDWFGALFINVLGTWTGDFDVAGPHGEGTGTPIPPAAGGRPAGLPENAVRAVKVYQFATDAGFTPDPPSDAAPAAPAIEVSRADPAITPAAAHSGAILGTATSTPDGLPEVLAANDTVSLITLVAGLALLATVVTVVIRRYRADG